MEEEYTKSNREKRMEPIHRGRFWCSYCDANMVHVGEKCSVCGYVCGKRTIKKETNA